MKAIHKLMALAALCGSCVSADPGDDIRVNVLVDRTDTLILTPNGANILEGAGLTADPWRQVTVTVGEISDQRITASKTLRLPGAQRLTGNRPLRAARIRRFGRALDTVLSDIRSLGSLEHSLVYERMVKELVALASTGAKEKHLLLYSDCAEHGDINFYDPAIGVRLRKAPGDVARQLDARMPLPRIDDVHVWFLYRPPSYEAGQAYTAIVGFYKALLESHGAIVHVEQSFTHGS